MSWSDLLTPPGDYLAITLGALGLLGVAGLVDPLVKSSWQHVRRIAAWLRRGADAEVGCGQQA